MMSYKDKKCPMKINFIPTNQTQPKPKKNKVKTFQTISHLKIPSPSKSVFRSVSHHEVTRLDGFNDVPQLIVIKCWLLIF